MIFIFVLLLVVLPLTTSIILINVYKRILLINAVSDTGAQVQTKFNLRSKAKIERNRLITMFKNTYSIRIRLTIFLHFFESIIIYAVLINLFINISSAIIIMLGYYLLIALDQLFFQRIFYDYWEKANNPTITSLSPKAFHLTQRIRNQIGLLYFCLMLDFLGILYFLHVQDLVFTN
ncbi:hypothetical protein MUDAN_BIHEEGNE_00556 [Lactiplantibacillus mudanjiangensis]|uniref:Uncharacterized protein n=1 Tax=Lactiplantibacillus mudanjiangensis TaxID=1296538 RepID=A0A660DZF4_9LACO|nr:hypothetical protein MUDAN_BIHEEGNE_00556 [Lactiplantibacillus mudanjiangensis]VDG24803.1 hypothetical protein MUDAN_IGPPGNFN_00833 [Lactiplantibacillus mudanjiangensis]VDG28450.1 hypothetical protein MUDAN_MDHGFNIF_00636 [Lactiplantibacillus mudanjiangensis]